MSYNALNPYQTFYTSTGAVRSLGTVTFYTNTTTTLASIYSDEALTVAQNNPYTLDASGRIAGDVKYSGLMSIQVANADGSDIVSQDNVASAVHALDTANNNKPAADFAPATTATYDIGTTSLKWAEGHFSGDVSAGTFAATTDTAAGDTASIGYTAAEGLILTGQGSTNDVTIKNDADADVITIPTGATGVDLAGALTVAGNVTLAGTLIGAGGNEIDSNLFAVKAGDESVSSADTGTTLQDDDDLQFTLGASAYYEIEMRLHITCASTTPEFKFAYVAIDGTWGLQGIFSTNTASFEVVAVQSTGSATQDTADLNGTNDGYLTMKGIAATGGAGGLFKLQWAQNVSDATAVVVKAGSYMRATKLA